jgi:methionyl-tRNA formyltransferase
MAPTAGKEREMRIAIMGQAAFGARCLEALVDRGEEVIAVWLPQGRAGAKPDPLQVAAAARQVPAHRPESYRSPEISEEFKASKPDLLIMAFVTDIIPRAFIEIPSLGAICYHPSLLPRHRGGSAINWALIMGDRETGLSIFWPDSGIDTGPILLQKRIPVGEEDTTGSLYFNHLFPLGIEAIAESVDLIRAGKAPRIVQDQRLATYEPLCNDKVAGIAWERPAEQVYNLIRGCDPQPGAYSYYQGEKVRFFEAKRLHEPASARPGEIVAVEAGGITVAASGGLIRIGKVRTEQGKHDAGAFAAERNLKPGDRFTGA